jgi:hypothetical protein
MKKQPKMRAPFEVRTFDHVCQLERDNIETRKSWMSIQPDGSVSIYNQMNGKQATGNVSLTRAEFIKFAEFYVKPQRIVKD